MNLKIKSLLILGLSLSLAGCGGNDKKKKREELSKKRKETIEEQIKRVQKEQFTAKKKDKTERLTYKNATHKTVGSPEVEMKIKNYGTVKIKIDSRYAPVTAANFIEHVKTKFYDGLSFQRLVKGSFIQGGDPTESGEGSSTKFIKGEFAANKVKNPVNPDRGVIAMARATATKSDRSQFFISLADNQKEFYGQYATFGKVTSGMKVFDEISKKVKTYKNSTTINKKDRPVIEYIKITKEK